MRDLTPRESVALTIAEVPDYIPQSVAKPSTALLQTASSTSSELRSLQVHAKVAELAQARPTNPVGLSKR